MIILGKTTAGKIIAIQVDDNGVVQVGGSVAETPHVLLDGSINSDTVAGAPSQDDVIIGQVQGGGSTLWQKIARSIFNECARVTHNAAQAATTAVALVLAFNTERFDTNAIHDTAVNNSRLTCKTAGLYLIVGNIEWAANATGYRRLDIRLNGATLIASEREGDVVVAAITTIQHITTIYQLAVNDYVELLATQTSGGNLNVNSTANISPEFMMVRVG